MIPYLENLRDAADLSREEMREAMSFIMDGAAHVDHLMEFLTLLADKGETPEEITGAAEILREMVTPINAPAHAVDCCGTGGDASGTYNISTAVALVSAACGVPVAKHGNRASSSKSGAADVLEALGVNLEAPIPLLEEALNELGFAFLMAPNHHKAMKHVAPVRKALGRRTIFNLLGPLANPAGATRQLLGVYDPKWCRPMVQALQNLGSEAVLAVHGAGGLDEISTLGDTHVAELSAEGKIMEYTISPLDFRLRTLDDMTKIQGGDAAENAEALKDVLKGTIGPYRDIVIANTAAVLVLAEKFDDYTHAAQNVEEILDSAAAMNLLKRYINMVK